MVSQKLSDIMSDAKEKFAEAEKSDVKYRSDLKNEKAKEKKNTAVIAKEVEKQKELEMKIKQISAEQPKCALRMEQVLVSKSDAEKVLENIFDELKGKTESLRKQVF